MSESSTSPPTTTSPTDTAASTPALHPLSKEDFRIYNSFAEQMEHFHNHFRTTWDQIYSHPLPAQTLLTTVKSFVRNLHTHHAIEEAHFFPALAKRMPQFRDEESLLAQHEEIRAGLDRLSGWVRRVEGREVPIDVEEVRMIMDGFGGVLWRHLDDEVEVLGAENMRRYWSLEEMGMFRV